MLLVAKEFREGFRSLLRNPAANAVVIATVGLAICAAATIFTVIDALLLKPLPGIDTPAQLVNVHATAPDGSSFHGFSYPTWKDLGNGQDSFSGLAAFGSRLISLSDGGEAQLGVAQIVTGNYFRVLGVRPAAGRLLGPQDDAAPGRDAVAVVSHRAWRERFGADPALVGRILRINGHPFTVIGVAPPGFQGTFLGFPFDVWVPTMMVGAVAPEDSLDARSVAWLEMVGRLKPGITAGAARSALDARMRQLERDFPGAYRGVGFDLRPTTGFEDSLREPAIRFFALLAALGFSFS